MTSEKIVQVIRVVQDLDTQAIHDGHPSAKQEISKVVKELIKIENDSFNAAILEASNIAKRFGAQKFIIEKILSLKK